MTKAIRVHSPGGPEVLSYEDVPTPEPGPGEARVRHEAIGLNYIDVYFRSGLYKTAYPATIGMEAAGVVDAVGAGVTTVKPGDRVAYATAPIGAYATSRVISADRLVIVPDGISSQTAAAMMLQGMTVQYLVRSTYAVKRGDPVLLYAAAGGVGLIMCQWIKHLGGTVIGVVSTEQKAALARAHGATHTLLSSANIPAEVRRITDGAMVPVVYDSIGKDTVMSSLDSLRPRGLFVSFGNSSGPITNFDLGLLSAKGSLYVTRPTLATYTAKRADLEAVTKDLFDVVKSGVVKIEVNQTYPLADAAAAHTALEARQTTGSTVLIP
jgi:NADPH2:quinone reductase